MEVKQENYIFASNNPLKMKQARSVFPRIKLFQGRMFREIQHLSYREIATQKALDALKVIMLHKGSVTDAVVEDTSFEIEELGGSPGPYISDFLASYEETHGPEEDPTTTYSAKLGTLAGDVLKKSRASWRSVVAHAWYSAETGECKVTLYEGVLHGWFVPPAGPGSQNLTHIFAPDDDMKSMASETADYWEELGFIHPTLQALKKFGEGNDLFAT